MRLRSLVVTLSIAACARTETVTRVVNLNVTTACPLPSGSFGEYVATGDYAAPASNHSRLIATDQAGQSIDGIPADAQSLALLVTPPDETSWQAVSLLPPSGDFDMLLLPEASACALNTVVGYADAMVFAAVSSHTLIASGSTTGNQLHPSYDVSLGTGHVVRMTNGIGTPRTHAATAVLGDGRALVIGGVSGSIVEQSVEIFDEATGDFEATTFPLREPRTDPGAVALANGDVLVAGGQGLTAPVQATERITFDAATSAWRTNEGTTPPLTTTRLKPYVLRLADGSVLVGGGFDSGGAPVPGLDMFTPDATSVKSQPLVVNSKHAFVALDGGGALFITAPEPTDPIDFQRAWFISPSSGAPTPIHPDITAPLTDVKLFPRAAYSKAPLAGGGALLWTGATWLAYDAWTGFGPLANAPTKGPEASSPIVASDPGMRAWIASDGTLFVWRDSVRNAFSTEGPYLLTDASFTTPDRFPAPSFDPSSGVSLSNDETVFVADARFLDVAIDVDGDASAPPHVVLRAPSLELDVGGPACPFTGSASHVHVERRGAFVSFALGGGPLSTCAAIASDARVALGVRGGRAENLAVTRLSAALR